MTEPKKFLGIQIGPQEDLTNLPNPLITDFYTTGTVCDKGGGRIEHVVESAIPADEGMALYNWIRLKGVKNTLEIGMGYALSTLFICQAHLDNGGNGRHIAIDPRQDSDYHSIGLLNIQRAKLEHLVEFFDSPSHRILPQLLERSERLDLIFIDGMHTFDFTLVDFFYSDSLLKVGGHIIFDDVWLPSVRKVMMYILRNRSYRLDSQLFGDSISLLQIVRNLISVRRWKRKVKINALQFIQNPLDLYTIFLLAYLGLRGGVKYWGLQKLAEDDRQWDFHNAF